MLFPFLALFFWPGPLYCLRPYCLLLDSLGGGAICFGLPGDILRYLANSDLTRQRLYVGSQMRSEKSDLAQLVDQRQVLLGPDANRVRANQQLGTQHRVGDGEFGDVATQLSHASRVPFLTLRNQPLQILRAGQTEGRCHRVQRRELLRIAEAVFQQ